jgi:hypothetical protein
MNLRTTLLAAAMILWVWTTANASGSHEIHFQKGKECLSYQGKDSSFVGKFLSWSSITVRAFIETEGGLKDAKVKVYRNGSEAPIAGDGSYPTPEGGDAVYKFDVQTDQPPNTIHFHVCSTADG